MSSPSDLFVSFESNHNKSTLEETRSVDESGSVDHCRVRRRSYSCNDEFLSKHRKELFGDCALIEIIHLHDCFRGALKSLESDVLQLASSVQGNANGKIVMNKITDLERRVAGRFKVIWTVFKSHSHAEDEFIWPALKTKTSGQIAITSNDHNYYNNRGHDNSNNYNNNNASFLLDPSFARQDEASQIVQLPNYQQPVVIEQEEYEEDHADEERMFSQMDCLLTKLRNEILPQSHHVTRNNIPGEADESQSPVRSVHEDGEKHVPINDSVLQMVNELLDHTRKLSKHLMQHLEKEESQCLPLVVKHLSKDEIHELVGQIMGRRSADTIAHIMTMAIQNLEPADRVDMVKYMKQSMAGTFFDRWLLMSGWMKDINADSEAIDNENGDNKERHLEADKLKDNRKLPPDNNDQSKKCLETSDNICGIVETSHEGIKQSSISIIEDARKRAASLDLESSNNCEAGDMSESSLSKRWKDSHDYSEQSNQISVECTTVASVSDGNEKAHVQSCVHGDCSITSQAELEKLIRAIGTNPSLTLAQKNTTIQGLRDSVWKSNQRQKQLRMQAPTVVNEESSLRESADSQNQDNYHGSSFLNGSLGSSTILGHSRTRRVTPPSVYYRKNKEGKVVMVWSSSTRGSSTRSRVESVSAGETSLDGTENESLVDVPLFSASELAPTYHDGAAGSVLGCPHYACACKLRHPKSGRLYTCRLCCEQERELPNRDQDEMLDRYAVTEIMCMKCNALQPSGDRCINPECESHGKAFARYFCRICNLYDDGSRPIFHCPYCNTCRIGLGLGIDYRHCMRCNACVALSDTEHRCIPQKLQGSCPICHESLFLSTLPLRGLRCGHVMHLSCYTQYIRGLNYTCPLCMRSMEDMKDYFALLDTAIRMQPMPAEYLNTRSNIYCQDCTTTGQVPYHMVGRKCGNCGSYNTRELGRVNITPNTMFTPAFGPPAYGSFY